MLLAYHGIAADLLRYVALFAAAASGVLVVGLYFAGPRPLILKSTTAPFLPRLLAAIAYAMLISIAAFRAYVRLGEELSWIDPFVTITLVLAAISLALLLREIHEKKEG